MKPLFIPLKTQFYEAFERGEKEIEYRLYGPRWNERTCKRGRPVVLSKGYGKKHRMEGKVSDFFTLTQPWKLKGWTECYGKNADNVAACIRITLRR